MYFHKGKIMKRNKNKNIDVIRYDTKHDYGLNSEQIEERVLNKLNNDVPDKITKSYFQIFFKNLFTFFNLLCFLCFIAMLSVHAELADFSFVVVFLINCILSIIQEIRSKRTLDKLTIVSTPTATVIRNGETILIPIKDILLDDIIMFSLGDQIPADCILIEGTAEVNESLLTGESVPVKKELGDALLSGSFVSSGSCVCRVDKVGQESYVQKLSAQAKKQKSANSKLLTSINFIIKIVGILIFPIAGVTGLVNYQVLSDQFVGQELALETVTRTVTVIIGMIPSGMFLLTTMALAVGVIKLAKINTLVQDLYSLEMLARVDILCLDKTGTITDGQMEVKEVITLNEHTVMPVENAIFSMENALNDNNQTATALRNYFSLGEQLSPLKIIPFSSQKKYSAVSFAEKGTYVLGAPNYIFPELPESIQAHVNKHASLGCRVLMFAYSSDMIIDDAVPKTLTPLCLIVIEDNIRKEAIETIAWFKQNGVNVKVISGDDPITVSEISKRAGIENADNYINLFGLKEKEIWNIADKYTVFGRVSPEQKAILVKALKNHGHTVAMTGDGVNDILAMKEADCSVTVASGSAASKSVAHLVLMDNNFNSMPKVVAEGRRVINNIQQSSSLFLMKTLFTMTFAIIAIITRTEYPYTPRMMIMIELVIIGLPSFFLSLQPNKKRVSGNFIVQVFLNALPGALILVLNVFTIQLVAKEIGLQLSENIAESMSVVILTFGGWVFLVELCSPADLYKGFLIFGVSVILMIWVVFLLDTPLFNLTPFIPLTENWPYILLIVCIVQFDFPLLALFKKILAKLQSTTASQDI